MQTFSRTDARETCEIRRDLYERPFKANYLHSEKDRFIGWYLNMHKERRTTNTDNVYWTNIEAH